MRLRLRPFHQFIEREPGISALEIVGRVAGDGYVVCALGRDITIPTVVVSADEFGPFVEVEEGEWDVADGFRLQLEVEPDELMGHGAHLHLFLEGTARRTLRLEAGGANVVAPHERSFSVYFSSAGVVDGDGATLRDVPNKSMPS